MLQHLLLTTLLLAASLCFAKDRDRFLQPGLIHADKAGQKWVDKTMRKMSSEQKVGQLFAIWVRVQFLNDADPIVREAAAWALGRIRTATVSTEAPETTKGRGPIAPSLP